MRRYIRQMNENTLCETDRVRRHTSPAVRQTIDAKTRQNVEVHAMSPAEVDDRIAKLETEWDIERVLETNASLLALGGVVLGATVSKKWLLLSGGVLAFLFQHATSGWCPPLPVLRRLGVRTRREIDRELYALKALRGDFREVARAADPAQRVGSALAAVGLA
jgi:hypothetical protein